MKINVSPCGYWTEKEICACPECCQPTRSEDYHPEMGPLCELLLPRSHDFFLDRREKCGGIGYDKDAAFQEFKGDDVLVVARRMYKDLLTDYCHIFDPKERYKFLATKVQEKFEGKKANHLMLETALRLELSLMTATMAVYLQTTMDLKEDTIHHFCQEVTPRTLPILCEILEEARVEHE